MPRYVRKQRSEPLVFDAKKIVNAIKDMKMNKRPERVVAGEYGIARTSLRRYKDNIEKEFPNQEVVTDEEMIKFIESKAGWATQTVG